jgi:hypothetical protein
MPKIYYFIVIHIGTSAQVVVMFDSENIGGKVRSPTWSNTDTSHLRLMPYFGGKFLLVAASLNGGNVLSAFAKV